MVLVRITLDDGRRVRLAASAASFEAELCSALRLAGPLEISRSDGAALASAAELNDGDELRVAAGRVLLCRLGADGEQRRLRVAEDAAWADVLQQLRRELAPELSGLATHLEVCGADGFAIESAALLFGDSEAPAPAEACVREVVRLCLRVPDAGPAHAVSVPLDPQRGGAPGVDFGEFRRSLAQRLLEVHPQLRARLGGLAAVVEAAPCDADGFEAADLPALLADGGAALPPGVPPARHAHPHTVRLTWRCSVAGLRAADGAAAEARLVRRVPLEPALGGGGSWGQRLGRWLRHQLSDGDPAVAAAAAAGCPVTVLPGGAASLLDAPPIDGPQDVPIAGADGAPAPLRILRQRLAVDGGGQGAQQHRVAVPAACTTWAQLRAVLARQLPPDWRLAELGCLPVVAAPEGAAEPLLLSSGLGGLPPHDGARLTLLRTLLYVRAPAAAAADPSLRVAVPLACADAGAFAALLADAAGLAPDTQEVAYHIGDEQLSANELFARLIRPAAAEALVAAGGAGAAVVTVGPAAVNVTLHCDERQVPCQLPRACATWAGFEALVRAALELGPQQAFVAQTQGWGDEDGRELSSDEHLEALREAADANQGSTALRVVRERTIHVRTPDKLALGAAAAPAEFAPVSVRVQVPHAYGGSDAALVQFEKCLLCKVGGALVHEAADAAPPSFGTRLTQAFMAAPRAPLRLYAEQQGGADDGAVDEAKGDGAGAGAGAGFALVRSCDEIADGRTYHLVYACGIAGCTGASTDVCRLPPPPPGAGAQPPCGFACRACLLAHIEALTGGEYVEPVDRLTGTCSAKEVRNPVGAGSLESGHFQFANDEKWRSQVAAAYYEYANPKNMFDCPLSLMETEVQESISMHCSHTPADGGQLQDHRFDKAYFGYYLKSKIELLDVDYDRDLVCPHPAADGACGASLFKGPGGIFTKDLVVTCLKETFGEEEGARLWQRIERHNQNKAYAMCPKCDEPQDIARWVPGDAARTYTCRHAACAHRFCSKCCSDEHGGMSCEEYRDNVKQRENTQLAREMRAGGLNIKQCPRCLHPWEKAQGCQHMECSVKAGGCGLAFCWDCLSGAGRFGRPVEVEHSNAFHQNECRQFLQCCAANCMVEHDHCQNGNHTYNPDRCPACRAAGELCDRAVPQHEHQHTYFAVGQRVTCYDQEAVRPLVAEIKGLFGGAFPDREQAYGEPRYADLSARAEREGRKRATVTERSDAGDDGLRSYTIQLEAGGAPLDVSARQISHLVADSGIMAKFPDCRCDSCLWVAIDDAADARENPDPAIQRAGEEARAELDARRLFDPAPGAQGGAGADEVKE